MGTVAPFLVGLPLAIGFLLFVHLGPLSESALERYLHHPVEMVEVVLFACATAALVLKLLALRGERAALKLQILPHWTGTPVAVSEAPALRAGLYDAAGKHQNTILVRRIDAILDFVRCRFSADGLDDQIRALADTDSLAQENSFGLIRFITWAIPILGFLGTVLGITTAIAGVTPEVLEKSISNVTDGLAVAFDATAVALALTMVTMFLSFLTERFEQNLLEEVDRFVEIQLAHRFERGGSDQGHVSAALHHNTQVVLQMSEQLVQKQSAIWATALAAAQKQWAEVAGRQEQLLGRALEQALDKTLQAHQARLASVERQVEEKTDNLVARLAGIAELLRDSGKDQQQTTARTVEALAAQTASLSRLQEDGKQLARLQEALNQNLAALQGAGAFEQAVQSLTAAIHMLTIKAAPAGAAQPAHRTGARPGAAA